MKRRAPSVSSERAPTAVEVAEAKIRELSRTLHIVEEARATLADQYDYAPIGFLTLDAKGCVREINLTAARLLGRERSMILAMPFFPFIAKGHLTEFMRHLTTCRYHHSAVVTELAVRTRLGATVPVELRSVPVFDRDGVTVYRTVMTNITDRLRISADLRQSEQRHRDLVELSPDGIFIEYHGAIVFANRAATRFCGAESPREVIGRRLTDLVRRADRRSVTSLLEESRTTHDGPRIEAKLLCTEGKALEVEMVARPFMHDGEPAMLVVARDSSRRVAAERQVLAISEQEKTRMGRDLHDGLSQNLMGASWRAEALRNQLRKVDPAAAARADEIAQIVRNCMAEARSLARGLCPVTMEQNGLIAALQEFAAEIAGRSQVACSLDCDEHLNIADLDVATHVYRIAQEAVANAIKHGKARTVTIRLTAQAGQATLSVRDDGKGLPSQPRGAGMGLHTMRYRASVIGGILDIKRGSPRGTLVTCTFPDGVKMP